MYWTTRLGGRLAETSDELLAGFERDGFVILRGVLSGERLEELRAATEGMVVGTGMRFALGQVGACGEVEREVMRGLAAGLAGGLAGGAGVRPVRSILFDKTAASNWLVPWHQDLTVAVAERREVVGWGPWSEKEGVVHVQPGAGVLEGMVTLRLHLDDTPAGNGALRVVPGSHLVGVVSGEAAREVRGRLGEVVCEVLAGDVVAMRPMILHASSKAAVPGRRRVLHVEYSGGDLPGGLRWVEGG